VIVFPCSSKATQSATVAQATAVSGSKKVSACRRNAGAAADPKKSSLPFVSTATHSIVDAHEIAVYPRITLVATPSVVGNDHDAPLYVST
jgi:hypothetical protein